MKNSNTLCCDFYSSSIARVALGIWNIFSQNQKWRSQRSVASSCSDWAAGRLCTVTFNVQTLALTSDF